MGTSTTLTSFFSRIERDGRISITHIGIFAALLQYRLEHANTNPIQAFSREIMEIAKISAPTTYHKCIRELHDYGYIVYQPSFKSNYASKIYFLEAV